VNYTKRFSTRGNTVMKNEVQWKKSAIENGAKQGANSEKQNCLSAKYRNVYNKLT